jgi:hypothetical protein
MDRTIRRGLALAIIQPMARESHTGQPPSWDLSSADYLERLFADAREPALYGILSGTTSTPATAERRARYNLD